MQWLLGRLKGRLGAAVGLAVVVLAVIGIGRATGGVGGDSAPPAGALGAEHTFSPPAVSAPPGDDGVEGAPTTRPPRPSLSPGAAEPLKQAGKFLDAWLSRELSPDAWLAGVRPYATTRLITQLTGVDPAAVPAQRTTGEPELIRDSGSAAAVRIAVDSGTVELRLVVVDGRWLVDGVDWSRS